MARNRRKHNKITDSPYNIEAVDMNNLTYMYYFERLKELAMSMFSWKDLPNEIDSRFIELTLFEKGYGLFSVDEVIGSIFTQVALGGTWNIYNIPNNRQALASNGYNRKLDPTNSVICYNNYLHTNSVNIIAMYAKRLANIERTIDINIHAQRTPVLIACNENERLSMKNLYEDYNGLEPVIFGSNDLNQKEIKALKTDAPFVATELMQLKFQIWNECLTYLGISNVNMHKKERLLNDEVTRNMGSTVASRYSRLDSRKQACEKCNKMFGWNIDVVYREDIDVLAEQVEQQMFNPVTDGVASTQERGEI